MLWYVFESGWRPKNNSMFDFYYLIVKDHPNAKIQFFSSKEKAMAYVKDEISKDRQTPWKKLTDDTWTIDLTLHYLGIRCVPWDDEKGK